MKKGILLAIAVAGAFLTSTEMKANSTFYYAKCTVEVAEDSKGLGTVYIEDADGEHVTEAYKSGEDYGSMNTGATAWFTIVNVPAEGYVFANFTDQDGNVYRYPDEDNLYMLGLFATSTDPDEPTVYNLSAHFIDASLVSDDSVAEVTVGAEERFGTFMSPVETEIPSDFNAYTVVSVADGKTVLRIIEGGTLAAFQPVLLENVGIFDATFSVTYSKDILPDELPDMTEGVLTGTMEDILLPEGAYKLEANGEEDSEFTKYPASEVLDAYQCYLTMDGDEQPSSISVSLLQTGVEAVNADTATRIYDVTGCRIKQLGKGVNIVNGKKIIVM